MKFRFFASGQYKHQVLAAIVANIISFSHGIGIGWLSPILLILQSNDTPLESGPISVTEESWLGSIYTVGAISGNFIFGFIASTFGRKICLISTAFPQMVFWLIIMFGPNINYLYAGRVIAGLTGGGLFVGVPIFVAEVSDLSIRAGLGSILMLCFNAGVMVGFVVGAYLPYNLIPKVLISLPIIFVLTISFFPETPQFLFTKGKEEECRKSIMFYKNLSLNNAENMQEVSNVLNEYKENIASSSDKEKLSLKSVMNRETAKIFFQGIGVCTLYNFAGSFEVINYAGSMFKNTGLDFDPNTSSIIVAAFFTLGTYLSTLVADRYRRKSLVIASAAGTAFSYIVVGTFTICAKYFDLNSFNWVPVACISSAVFCGAIGYNSLTHVILSEILPQRIRALGSSVCNVILNIESFCLLKAVPLMMAAVGVEGVEFFFCVSCLLGILFFIFFMPETKRNFV